VQICDLAHVECRELAFCLHFDLAVLKQPPGGVYAPFCPFFHPRFEDRLLTKKCRTAEPQTEAHRRARSAGDQVGSCENEIECTGDTRTVNASGRASA